MISKRWSPLLLALLVGLLSCSRKEPPAPPPEVDAGPAEPVEVITFAADQLSSFGQLPKRRDRKDNPISREKIALGRMLYFDARLSREGDLACNTCHALDAHGVDPRGGVRATMGHPGQTGERNAPSVYNAAVHSRLLRDGRESTVELPLADPEATVAALRAIPGYAERFAAVFPGEEEPITPQNVSFALGAFLRGLMTPSRFDAYLGGDAEALTLEEKRGLKTFLALGCPTCHNGVALGATSLQPRSPGGEAPEKLETPSLRNVAKTAPYGHTGEVASLEAMVRRMAEERLDGKALDEAQVESLLTFLEALTGELPADYIARPELPAAPD
ncbi:MAG: cytochrome c peroxidase [Deltaproteobacteria bacterium]|nr:cytochrome c peroxidase [Deltaproteobacteria bacterium]